LKNKCVLVLKNETIREELYNLGVVLPEFRQH